MSDPVSDPAPHLGSSRQSRRVRLARPSDLRHLAAIEEAGAAMLAEHFGAAAVPALTATAPTGSRRDSVGLLLVAEEADALVGFAHLVEADGQAHLEQVSVLPEHGRRGIGTALVRAALEEAHWQGYLTMTLCTYRDVPWNGPFYAGLGFAEVREPAPEVARLRIHERASGLDRSGPRMVMGRAVR